MKHYFDLFNQELEKLSRLDREYDRIYCELTRISEERRKVKYNLERLEKIKSLAEQKTPSAWQWLYLGQSRDFPEYEWSEAWTFTMAGFLFYITLAELRNPEKGRYFVKIQGIRNGDAFYLQHVYTLRQLNRYFDDIEKARKCVKQWQSRLLKDYEAELDLEMSVKKIIQREMVDNKEKGELNNR
ncbi:hypothetical protein [Desulforamulus ruminis]|uniref:Uncharacterized protein n=1 Tax=Desulforamulus ruminis (strain ATCC 23193 / DSM 2154 / NCIMB 8452 / DL) TaxID=696281 RepID=F6DPZ9_DESRL|nr:hypothetical protein [Desulforamulus ruminis]AEG61943.1 hypothetical protein Desru_3743 [Desulforamulus ruminis DSM 2154]